MWPPPRALPRLAAPFHPTACELLEVRPFWRSPVRLDEGRLVASLLLARDS